MVKGPELQNILESFTNTLYDNLWLGGMMRNGSTQFKWIDGEPLTYSNWANGYPRNISGTDTCIYVPPPNAKNFKEAKWEDTSCNRRNLAICQKKLLWTLQDAVTEILKVQKELNITKQNLFLTKAELNRTRTELSNEIADVYNRVIPVGSIYIEYYLQPSPRNLWPRLSWQDITSMYAGLFFRALGGKSETWGTSQSSCAPRITQVQGSWSDSYTPNPLSIPENGWSDWGLAGLYYNNTGLPARYDVHMFHTEGCEVRPTNQAVRIWKRTA